MCLWAPLDLTIGIMLPTGLKNGLMRPTVQFEFETPGLGRDLGWDQHVQIALIGSKIVKKKYVEKSLG